MPLPRRYLPLFDSPSISPSRPRSISSLAFPSQSSRWTFCAKVRDSDARCAVPSDLGNHVGIRPKTPSRIPPNGTSWSDGGNARFTLSLLTRSPFIYSFLCTRSSLNRAGFWVSIGCTCLREKIIFSLGFSTLRSGGPPSSLLKLYTTITLSPSTLNTFATLVIIDWASSLVCRTLSISNSSYQWRKYFPCVSRSRHPPNEVDVLFLSLDRWKKSGAIFTLFASQSVRQFCFC